MMISPLGKPLALIVRRSLTLINKIKWRQQILIPTAEITIFKKKCPPTFSFPALIRLKVGKI